MSVDIEKSENTNAVVNNKQFPLTIFRTEEDKIGIDISKMSNFFDGYIHDLTVSIQKSSSLYETSQLPISDLTIIGEVINKADIFVKRNLTLLPDFDSLPLEIRKKLKKGIYSIGESKQVKDNLRAVVLDENGVRVKDITLKKVLNNSDNMETMRIIGNQMQMRQIHEKLSEIHEFQTYQIQRDRDRDIIVPFLDARSLVMEAATKLSEPEQIKMLREADNKIRTAINSVYTDIETSSKNLVKKVESPFGYFSKVPNTYMHFISDDLQILTKFVGVRLQILEYLNERETANLVLENYQKRMLNFIKEPITKNGLSTSMLMHDYFPYNATNINFWFKFTKEIQPVLEKSLNTLELKNNKLNTQEIYIVSMEDSTNE